MSKISVNNLSKCYVNSYGWRRKFYNSSGFVTEDTIGLWHKKIIKEGE